MCSTPRKKGPDLSLTDSCTLTNCILSSSSSSLHPISSTISSIVSYQCQQGVGHKLSYQCQQGHTLLINQCQTNGHNQQPMSTRTQAQLSMSTRTHALNRSMGTISNQCQHGHKLSYQCQQGHTLLMDQCQTNWHNQQPMSTQTQELHQCQTNSIMFQPGRNYSQHCNELTIIFGLLIKEKVLIDVIPSYCCYI